MSRITGTFSPVFYITMIVILLSGVIMGIGIFGPGLGFGLGAFFSQTYVTLEGKSFSCTHRP